MKIDTQGWLNIALALLPLVQTGVTEFIAWINSMKATLQQAGEWTEEQEAAYQAALAAKAQDPAYQPDPPTPTPGNPPMPPG